MVNSDKDYYFLETGSPEETLFIPLFVKAGEFGNKAPIIKDQKAFEIADIMPVNSNNGRICN